MTQVLGIIDLIWLGTKLPVNKGGTFRQGGIVNQAMTAGRQTFNSQQYKESSVDASVPFRTGDSLAPYSSGQVGELQFVCDTGQTYVIADAFVVGQPEISGGGTDGVVKLKWAGSAAQEVINS